MAANNTVEPKLDSEQQSANVFNESDDDTLTSESDANTSSSDTEGETADFDDQDISLSSTDYFEKLYDQLFETDHNHGQNIQIQQIDLAFDALSGSPIPSEFTSSDEIKSFLTKNDTFLDTATSYIASLDPTHPNFDSTGDKNKIFVGHIPLSVTDNSLRAFFQEKGYRDVIQVCGPIYKGVGNRPGGFAFVTFASSATASQILDVAKLMPQLFKLSGNQLRLGRPTAQPSSKTSLRKGQIGREGDEDQVIFQLDSIMYGTLTGMPAMNILIGVNSENTATSPYTYGYIIHQRLDRFLASSCLTINTKQKKFSIDVTVTEQTAVRSGMEDFRFEWNFHDLKGNKFLPVVTHGLTHSYSDRLSQTIDPSVYVMCEIRRAPCISYVRHRFNDGSIDGTRLPGPSLMGRANAWLLRIDADSKAWATFAKVLDRYHLCAKHSQASYIVPLLRSIDQHTDRLVHLNLLSLTDWQERNSSAVMQFSSQRWPYFPFETKFEIMKLISKHIITINDLIVDERLPFILSKLTSHTLAACIDKIIEFGHFWQSTSERPNDEDWDSGDEEEENDEKEDKDESAIRTYHKVPLIYSATGQPLTTATSNSITIDLSRISFKDLHSSKTNTRLGSLSRLLCLALYQLDRKHQLNQTLSRIYLTKREIRAFKSDETSSIRKVYVTPSTVHFEGPHTEEACAVTRQFSELQDCFLRVSFRDEDFRKLRDMNNSMNVLYKHIESLMKNGLNICGRKYRFLAFSTSQIREHSCWMYHQRHTSPISCEGIREWMGDFQHIHPVAKMAARLGQSFSTTVKGKALPEGSLINIPDIASPTDSQALYTDGVGIIVPWFAKELAEQMNLDATPSAFQIRCGGYKGMVCVSLEDTIANNPQIRVAFRESMKKFDSNNHSIDIVQTSNLSLSYLNRQIILLLSSRRIPDAVFHEFQNEMLDKVMSINKNAKLAIDTLSKFNGHTGGNGTHQMMIEYLSRFQLNTEPFVEQLLFRFQAFQLKELRTKARILIDKGCILFGVADESRTLKHGEVFIQLHPSGEKESKIIEGPVIVTRNPCLHPGDIRRYQAVNNPRLHKLNNVIVFPMDGPRSMTAELAGGDLDGDTFWISWDSRLIFQENYPAFCYSDQARQARQSTANSSDQPHTINEICRFFVTYMKVDNLGAIADRHLVFADLHGVTYDKCLTLAEMHSIAVDFVKTGYSPRSLNKELQPEKYPHFMEKKDKDPYHSYAILGQLYDNVKKCRIDYSQHQNPNKKPFPYQILLVDGFFSYTRDAQILKEEYERELRRIMRHYGLHRESEIISGYITKFTSKQYAKQGKLFELRNEIANTIRSLRHRYIQMFWQEFYQPNTENGETGSDIWSKAAQKLNWHNQFELAKFHERLSNHVEQKASAWFYVTYKHKIHDNESSIDQRNRLYSFAWLVYPVLFHIYDQHPHDGETTIQIRHKKRNRNRRGRRRGRKNRR